MKVNISGKVQMNISSVVQAMKLASCTQSQRSFWRPEAVVSDTWMRGPEDTTVFPPIYWKTHKVLT